MNIVREQREQNNSLIKVTVGEKDYGDAVEKSLREYKRKANIPGFRPGMVPMGVIKKMYGKKSLRGAGLPPGFGSGVQLPAGAEDRLCR